MKKKIAMFLMTFVIFISGLFVFTACDDPDDDDNAKVTSIAVELVSTEYEMTDNIITVVYGSKVDLKYTDFKVTATLDNGKTKEISKKTADNDGYTYQSSIPQSYDKTPVNEYTIVFSYGEIEAVTIKVKVTKADFTGTLNWNYEEPFVYDGQEKQVEIVDLPTGVTVAYTGVDSATNAGTYTCTAIFTCTDSSNYKSIPNKELTWTINPAKIELGTITMVEKTYNESEQSAEISSASLNALPSNIDKVNYTITGETTATDVGEYTVVITFSIVGEDADNYTVDTVTTTWSIVEGTYASVGSVSFDGVSNFIYNGTERTVTIDYSELDSNVEVVGIPTNLSATNAGEYIVVITLEYTGNDTNYKTSAGTLTLTWEIEKATLTVTAKDHTITYGDAPSNDGIESIVGFVNGEDENVLEGEIEYSYNYEQFDDAGSYAIQVEGYSSDNYTINYVDGQLTVGKKALTIKPKDVEVTYNDAVPQFSASTSVDCTGLVGDDTIDSLNQTAVQFTCEYEAGSSVIDGGYAIAVSGYTSNNYEINYGVGTLTVNKATITVSGVALEDNEIEYTGEVKSVVLNTTNIEPAGVTATIVKMDKNDRETINVGEYVAVVSLVYTDTTNYELIPNVELRWQIVKADIDVSSYDILDKTLEYNGRTQSVQFNEVPAGVEITSISENSAKDVGLYTCVVQLACSNLANYNDIPAEYKELRFNWNITPKALTITANNNSVEYGSAGDNSGVQYSGFAEGENESVLTGAISYTYVNYSAGSNVGTYIIKIDDSVISNDNYDIYLVNGQLEVYAKEVDLDSYIGEWQAENSRYYNSTIPFKPVLVDLPEGVKANYTYSIATMLEVTPVENPIEIGSYMAEAVLVAENDNYILVNNNGIEGFAFEIVKCEIDASTLVWTISNGTEQEYSGNNLKPTYANTIDGLDISYTYYKENDTFSYDELEEDAEITAVGNYKVVATITCTDDTHYEIIANPVHTEINYSIIKISVTATALNFNISAVYDRQEESAIYYDAEVSYTGTVKTITLNGNEYLTVEYWTGSKYTTDSPTVTDIGQYSFMFRVTIADEYSETHRLSSNTSEFIYYLTVDVSQIIFTTLQVNGVDYTLEELTETNNQVLIGSVLTYAIKDTYAFVYQGYNEQEDSWGYHEVSNNYVFEEHYTSYYFYVIDKAINPTLSMGGDDGIIYSIEFMTYIVKQVIYGRVNETMDYPYGNGESYELIQGEDEFTITFDSETLAVMDNYSFAYQIIDSEGNWEDEYHQITSMPLTLTNLEDIHCIMLLITYDEGNNYYQITQFTIVQPTVVLNYTVTYMHLSNENTTEEDSPLGSTSYSLFNAFVTNFEVNLKPEFASDYTVNYYADEEHTISADYTDVSRYYIVYYGINDNANDQEVESGAFMMCHAFSPTFMPANQSLLMNAINPFGEDNYIPTYEISVDTQEFYGEFYLSENNGIVITQTYNGNDSITLEDGTQEVDYVLNITYDSVTYTFEMPIKVTCSLNIVECFTEDVQYNSEFELSYTYTNEEGEQTESYRMYRDYSTGINYIDLYDYNVTNVEDFESVLANLEFPLADNYQITSREIVNMNGKFYAKLLIEEVEVIVSNILRIGSGEVRASGDEYTQANYHYIELRVNGIYDSDVSAVINVNINDAFGEDFTVTPDMTEFTIDAPAATNLFVSVNNFHANIEIYYLDEEDNEIVVCSKPDDESYINYSFLDAGTYYLRITATDGTTKIYTITVAEVLPLLEFAVNGTTYTLTTDGNSNFIAEGTNVELYIGTFEQVPNTIVITNFKSTIMNSASLYSDAECQNEITDYANGFEVAVDGSNDTRPMAIFYAKKDSTVYTIKIYLSEQGASVKVLEVVYTDNNFGKMAFTVTQKGDSIVSDRFQITQIGEYNEKSIFVAAMHLQYETAPDSIKLDSVYCAYIGGTLSDINNPATNINSMENITLKVINENGYDFVAFNYAINVDDIIVSFDVYLYLTELPYNSEPVTEYPAVIEIDGSVLNFNAPADSFGNPNVDYGNLQYGDSGLFIVVSDSSITTFTIRLKNNYNDYSYTVFTNQEALQSVYTSDGSITLGSLTTGKYLVQDGEVTATIDLSNGYAMVFICIEGTTADMYGSDIDSHCLPLMIFTSEFATTLIPITSDVGEFSITIGEETLSFANGDFGYYITNPYEFVARLTANKADVLAVDGTVTLTTITTNLDDLYDMSNNRVVTNGIAVTPLMWTHGDAIVLRSNQYTIIIYFADSSNGGPSGGVVIETPEQLPATVQLEMTVNGETISTDNGDFGYYPNGSYLVAWLNASYNGESEVTVTNFSTNICTTITDGQGQSLDMSKFTVNITWYIYGPALDIMFAEDSQYGRLIVYFANSLDYINGQGGGSIDVSSDLFMYTQDIFGLVDEDITTTVDQDGYEYLTLNNWNQIMQLMVWYDNGYFELYYGPEETIDTCEGYVQVGYGEPIYFNEPGVYVLLLLRNGEPVRYVEITVDIETFDSNIFMTATTTKIVDGQELETLTFTSSIVNGELPTGEFSMYVDTRLAPSQQTSVFEAYYGEISTIDSTLTLDSIITILDADKFYYTSTATDDNKILSLTNIELTVKTDSDTDYKYVNYYYITTGTPVDVYDGSINTVLYILEFRIYLTTAPTDVSYPADLTIGNAEYNVQLDIAKMYQMGDIEISRIEGYGPIPNITLTREELGVEGNEVTLTLTLAEGIYGPYGYNIISREGVGLLFNEETPVTLADLVASGHILQPDATNRTLTTTVIFNNGFAMFYVFSSGYDGTNYNMDYALIPVAFVISDEYVSGGNSSMGSVSSVYVFDLQISNEHSQTNFVAAIDMNSETLASCEINTTMEELGITNVTDSFNVVMSFNGDVDDYFYVVNGLANYYDLCMNYIVDGAIYDSAELLVSGEPLTLTVNLVQKGDSYEAYIFVRIPELLNMIGMKFDTDGDNILDYTFQECDCYIPIIIRVLDTQE